jgi:hypothetical protein
MSHADSRNTTNPSRRGVLAGLSLAAVPAAVGMASAFGAAHDPIFGLIEAHAAATLAHNRASEVFCAIEDASPEYPDAKAAWHIVDDRETDARLALLTAAPTTLGGVAALLDYVGLPEYNDPSCGQTILSGGCEYLPDSKVGLRRASLDFHRPLAAAQRAIIAASTGAGAAIAALPIAASAHGVDRRDPIFAVVAKHQAALEAWLEAVHKHGDIPEDHPEYEPLNDLSQAALKREIEVQHFAAPGCALTSFRTAFSI